MKEEIPIVVHTGFEYDKYSEEDGSNERFLRKQRNTNQLVDSIFNRNNDTDNDIRNEELQEQTLF